MRKFYLYIGSQKTDMNGNGILFVSPTGLGVSMNNTIMDTTDGFAFTADKRQKRGQIVGKLVFIGDNTTGAYERYRTFASSAINAEKLKIGYIPFGDSEFLCDVELNYMTKTESYDDRWIEIPVAFDVMSMWYQTETVSGNGYINIPSIGETLTCVNVSINEAVVAPELIITDSDANTIAHCSVSGNVTNLRYSNNPIDSYVKDGDTDIIERVDISYPVFANNVSGCRISTPIAHPLSATVYRYWRTV